MVCTIEERRTGLWCWLLSSTVACYFQKHEPLPWSPYFDECLQILADNGESSSDWLLILFVRLQLVVEQATRVQWHEGLFDTHSRENLPSKSYFKALQVQLQDIKQAPTPNLIANEVLLLHMYSTEFTVYEVALFKTSNSVNGPDFQRLDALYACLRSVKDWFDTFLAIPPEAYIGVSMAVFAQMAHSIIALYRLSIFEYPGWDCGVVRDSANLSTILGQIVQNMAQVKLAAALDHGNSANGGIFSINSERVNSIRIWWDFKIASKPSGPETSIDDTMAEAPTDFWSDAWLQDVLGTGPAGFESFML